MIDPDRTNRCRLVMVATSSPAVTASASFRNHRAAGAFYRTDRAVLRRRGWRSATLGRVDRVSVPLDPASVTSPSLFRSSRTA